MAKISVIIPFKDSSADIKKVLYSVLNQNMQDFNILIVTDMDIDLPLSSKINIIKSDKEQNVSQMLNIGIKQTSSEYICLLNPNDLFLYNALKLRYEEFQKDKSLFVCYGLGIDTDINYQIKQNINYEYFVQKDISFPGNDINAVLSMDMNLSMSSLMFRKEVADNIEFNPLLKSTYLWDYFIRLFANYENKICQISDPIYISRDEEHNIRGNNQKYFIDFSKESIYVLDCYFSKGNITEELKEVHIQCFKNLYSYLFFILVEYFPYNFWLRFYLLISYLKKNKQFNNKLIDFWFIAILINSISLTKKRLFSNQFAQ